MSTNRYVLILMLWIALWVREVANIYSTPDVFYSQFCSLNDVSAWSGNSFNCPASIAQTNIIRAGMVLAQHCKHQYIVSQYTASLSDPGTSATSFTINYDIRYPSWLWMKLGFFVVIIKTQNTQKYIDLIPYLWRADSTINNNQASQRTVTATSSVTTSTIFTSGTAGLQLVPFTTSFIMFPPYSWGSPIQDVDIQFRLSATFSGNNAVVSLTAFSQTKIQQFIGVVILYNPPQVAVAVTKKWHMAFLLNSYSMGSSIDLSTLASAFGPNYNTKCILGIQRYKHQTDDKVFYTFGYSYWGFYDQLKEDTSSDVVLEGYFFCFGNRTQCGQNATHWDKMDGDCYHPTLCPLPVPSGWTVANACPNCTQLICLNCSVSNRSNCLSCEVNSTLKNGKCQCNTNYFEVNTSISTSTQGQWNNVADSLTKCLFNCTIFIPKCQATSCTNDTFCTACMTDYFVNPISPGKQNCINCSQAIPHCLTCAVLTACLACEPGFYVLPVNQSKPGQCDLCINKMAHCDTCTDDTICLTCITGYKINTTTNLCQCDVVSSNLTKCLTCQSPIACTSCVNSSYYLDSTDRLCHFCSKFDLMCLQCTAKHVCTLCQRGYTIVSNTDGTATCVLCSLLMSQCSECSSPTVCTDCNTFYGLTANNKCKLCSELIPPDCEKCKDNSSCLTCKPQNVLISGACQKCNQLIYKCRLCDLDSSSNVRCLSCQKGFYSAGSNCTTCLNLFDFCNDCTTSECFNCMSPYILGTDGECSQCIEGYWLVSGICMNIPGCVMTTSYANGSSYCIACAQQLNFVYDKRNKKCICAQGFTESHQLGQLMSCVPVCGDGIVLSNYEQCDDQNQESNDGCDSSCNIEKDFKCTNESPSKCILSLNFNKIEFNYISRVLNQNKGIMSFTIEPNHSGLSKMDWSKLMKFNFPSSTVDQSKLTFSYSFKTGQLLVTVPYNQELENFDMSAIITFDPKILISQPPTFYLGNKLNGINAPLVFESESSLSTTKNINLISSVLIGLLLLQFYLGSYFHKMIGLQTIQVIQSIYFVRMISTSASTSMLNSMNIIQYSACGYENAEIFYGQLQDFNTQSMGVIAPQFNAINMKQFFLLNANLSLIPVILALIIYGYSLARKYYSRNKFMETKEQQERDKYTDLKRKSQWVYDHFFFPFVMMFNLISFFFIVQKLTKEKNNSSSEQLDKMHEQSFPVHIVLTFIAGGIYCYEAILSAENNTRYRMTLKQKDSIPLSGIEKLEHDENNIDRANYHPAYVLVYLIYYLTLSLVMILGVLVESFQYSLELTIGLSTGYLILIFFWKPYHESINIHNHFLKLYYLTFVMFLVICYLFSKVGKLSQNLYIIMIYVIMVLISSILVIGFVRIVIEKLYRSKLQNDNSILQWKSPNQVQDQTKQNKQNKKLRKQSIIQSPSKKQVLMMNNSFVFENQLTELGKKYGFIQKSDQKPQLIKNKINKKLLSQQQQNFIKNKIKEQTKQKRQKLILDQLVDSFIMNQKYPPQQPIVNKLTQKYDSPFMPTSQPNQKSTNNKKPMSVDEQKQLQLLKLKLKNQWVAKRY